MKALVKTQTGPGNLELRDVADPTPGPGEVVFRVGATGICGTDLHIQDDEYVVVPPVTIGHETAGTIVAIGAGVTGLSLGDCVTAQTTISTCGSCSFCASGLLNLCPQRRWLGGHVDGGFAGYVKVPVANILLLPPTVTIEAGALTEPLACCVHGIMEVIGMSKEGWHPPFTVVSGPGPIGLLCAQVARAAGSVVIILGTGADASRFALARQLGFEDLIDVTRENITDVIRERTGGLGVDVAIEAAGAPSSLDGCLALVNRRGTVLQIGLYGRPAPVSVDVLVLKEITLRGTFSSTPSSWITAIDLMGSGQVDTLPLVTQVRPLEDWSAGFDAARAKGEGKIVLTPGER